MTKLDSAITDLANHLRPAVEGIEAGRPMTRNNYGAYLGILGMAKDNGSRGALVAALIEAGANVQGVRDAYKVFG